MKQARAFGLGIVLATQNPVGLDYKGLSNAGTWFIGRLQTERDKARILEGLEASDAGAKFGGAALSALLAGLEQRQFLMNNVHADAPVVFESRFAMSYLRGPVTRAEIKTLMAGRRSGAPPTPVAGEVRPAAPAATPAASAKRGDDGGSGARPLLPNDVSQLFLPLEGGFPEGGAIVYAPAVLGAAKVSYSDAKANIDFVDDVVFSTPITEEAVPVAWERGARLSVSVDDLGRDPLSTAQFEALPPIAAGAKKYAQWSKDLKTFLGATAKLSLMTSPSTKLVSNPGESEQEFRLRLMQRVREARDERVAELKQKYAPKLAQLDEKLRKAEAAVGREKAQAMDAKLATALSFGAALLGAFTGKSVLNQRNVGRATTALRGAQRAAKESGDVEAASETLEALTQQKQELADELNRELAELEARSGADEPLEAITLKPKKTGITVQLVALAWTPRGE